MASFQTYIGQQFGDFRITRHIGASAEAEVYEVSNDKTGQILILRLSASDDALWEGAPVNPPVNASLEIPNA